jgi:aspartyl-tRNA(Asn)/glutamyl-tRNA(Gln) amidotransferase subunit A
MSNGLNWLGVAESARLLSAGEASAVEIVESTVAWIERTGGVTNAFVTLDAEAALQEAAEVDRAVAAGDGSTLPLRGSTITVKDVIAVGGVPMRCGSEVLGDGFVPADDAFAVGATRRAGSAFLGKVATSEFSWGAVCPPARNPWNGTSVPGGSSGGSGAAVAAGQCAASIGADCGCSVRMPAALNGISGLRPTYGLVSLAGAVPLSTSMDTVGPLARSVEDVALLLTAMAGHNPADPTSATQPPQNFSAGLDGDVSGLRLGVPSHYFFDHLEADVLASVEVAIATFEELGMEVHEVELPHVDSSRTVFNALVLPEAAALLEGLEAEMGAPLGDRVRDLIELGNMISAKEYCQAQQMRRLIRGDFETVFEEVDVMITPTTAATARESTPSCAMTPVEYEDGFSEDIDGAYCRYSMPVSAAGCPGLAVPCGIAADGLPTSMQLVARPFGDATALRVGHAFQQVTDWHLQRPTFVAQVGASRA